MNPAIEEDKLEHIKAVAKVDLAACILFYERLDQTIECIQSFLPSGLNIYILNNGSSPSARQVLGRFCDKYKQIKIFDSDVNLGVAVGRNYLITHTTEEWLLFIDNDIFVKTKDWLSRFKQHISLNPDIEVFIPKLFNVHENKYSPHPGIKIEGNKAFLDSNDYTDLTNAFPGGASFINRKIFKRLGLYDDKMFIGFEDYELCIRGILSKAPVKCRLIHDIELVHNHRRVENDVDKKAALVRYDDKVHKESEHRIFEKHNVYLCVDWKRWLTDQREKYLNKRKSVPVTQIKQIVVLIKRKFLGASNKK
jgi:GT2 family glycosyltransferase